MKKKIRRFAVLVLLLLLIAGVLIPANEFRYAGNDYYSDAELTEQLFPGYFGKSILLLRLKRFAGNKITVPFIEKYSYSFSGLRSVEVQIYEKTLAGYVPFQEYNLYFDWDGDLVESSSRSVEGLLRITGLELDHAVLGSTLPVSDKSIFRSILVLSQYLAENTVVLDGEKKTLSELTDGLDFSGGSITVLFGSLRVTLGSAEYLEEKLGVMSDTLPELWQREGTLYLDTYSPGVLHPSYIFK